MQSSTGLPVRHYRWDDMPGEQLKKGLSRKLITGERMMIAHVYFKSGEDVPRGLEFLLSRNRLNVAISRARCLAYLVASPKLLEVNCKTIEQMRLANALCRFVELST